MFSWSGCRCSLYFLMLHNLYFLLGKAIHLFCCVLISSHCIKKIFLVNIKSLLENPNYKEMLLSSVWIKSKNLKVIKIKFMVK